MYAPLFYIPSEIYIPQTHPQWYPALIQSFPTCSCFARSVLCQARPFSRAANRWRNFRAQTCSQNLSLAKMNDASCGLPSYRMMKEYRLSSFKYKCKAGSIEFQNFSFNVYLNFEKLLHAAFSFPFRFFLFSAYPKGPFSVCL